MDGGPEDAENLQEVNEMNLKRYLTSVLTLAEFELRKIRHDSSQIWLRTCTAGPLASRLRRSH